MTQFILHRFSLCMVAFLGIATLLSSVASAQTLDLFYTDEEVQVISIKASKVCYGTLNLTSQNGDEAFFSTYEQKGGDRWQVAGYRGGQPPARPDDILTIAFDGVSFMLRGFEWDRSAFFLPFTDATELRDFDKWVADNARLELKLLRRADIIAIDLPALRRAREQISRCVGEL